MNKDNVISLENPEGNVDVLTGLLRSGARELITQAVQSGPPRNFPVHSIKDHFQLQQILGEVKESSLW